MAPRSKPRQSHPFSSIHPHAAGIDIGATAHVVAVARDRDPVPVRTFRTFSGDLHQLADWLHAVGITTIAMELWVDGPSIRTLHVNLDDALNEGSDQDDELARISGITRPEFPEPTPSALLKPAVQRHNFFLVLGFDMKTAFLASGAINADGVDVAQFG